MEIPITFWWGEWANKVPGEQGRRLSSKGSQGAWPPQAGRSRKTEQRHSREVREQPKLGLSRTGLQGLVTKGCLGLFPTKTSHGRALSRETTNQIYFRKNWSMLKWHMEGGTLNRVTSSATKKEQMTCVNNSPCDKLLLLSLSRLVQKTHNHSTAGSKTWRRNPKWKMT